MKKMKPSKSRGILYMVLASFLFGIMTSFVKLSSHTLPPFEIVFFRSLIGFLTMTVILFKEKESFTGKQPGLLFLRGLFGFTALAMNFYAISELNLGTAVILNYTSPIFVAVISAIFLKEKVSSRLWILIILCFTGLYFLVGPQLSVKRFPIMIGLISGIMAALAYVTISMAKREESSYTIIFYFSMISIIGSLPLLRSGFHIPLGTEWLSLLGVGVTASLAQIFLTRSIREAPASVVCSFSYLTPVFSFLAGTLIWKDPLTGRMIFGAGLVILSGSLIYILEKHAEPIVD